MSSRFHFFGEFFFFFFFFLTTTSLSYLFSIFHLYPIQLLVDPSYLFDGRQRYEKVSALSDIVTRKIPLLLLDSRERWPLVKLDAGNTQKTKLAQGWDTNGSCRPCEPPEWFEQTEDRKKHVENIDSQKWIEWVKSYLKSHYTHLHTEKFEKYSGESWNTSTLAYILGALQEVAKIKGKRQPGTKQKQIFLTLEEALRDSASDGSVLGVSDHESGESMARELTTFFLVDLNVHVLKAKIEAVKQFKKESKNSEEIDLAEDRLEKAEEELKMLEKKEKMVDHQEWLAVNDILASKKCYAESIFDLQSVEEIMGSIAKIDHLPESHTHEQLLLIYNAQSIIKYYKANADHYKIMSKISYVS